MEVVTEGADVGADITLALLAPAPARSHGLGGLAIYAMRRRSSVGASGFPRLQVTRTWLFVPGEEDVEALHSHYRCCRLEMSRGDAFSVLLRRGKEDDVGFVSKYSAGMRAGRSDAHASDVSCSLVVQPVP